MNNIQLWALAGGILLAVGTFAVAVELWRDSHPETFRKWCGMIVVLTLCAFVWAFAFISKAYPHDHNNPELDNWYAALMQPDNPTTSCCGKADAYWCDKINVKQGKTFCTITDDRDDAPLGRAHVPLGTEIEIPNHKLKWDSGNPTGHAIVFMPPSRHVWCFVQAGGV